jgi:2-C-methyl-D-erythritol 4-phosphate cytidylyltransferase / 2-C-methyl-D-erythritol 2,4-cyclodiphosphate synthase
MHIVAILAAAGRGTRLGAEVPKQFLTLGGRTILQWSVEAFERHDRVTRIVVAVPREIAANPPDCLRLSRKPVDIVVGGDRRQDSVSNAFDLVPSTADLVVVHDAARPFASQALISRVIDAAGETGAAVAAVPARDTVKEAVPASGGGAWVSGRTLPRDRIFLAQTPQAFRRQWLADAIALGRQGPDATDEAALVERAGHPVSLVEGEPGNFKITTIDDLRMARGFVQPEGQDMGPLRVGTGYDLHRLAAGRPLVLGGVEIPHAAGLAGHSDADALSHAITDAILGAAGAGDIGRHFPDTDARWAGASSLELLRQAAGMVRQAGFLVVNVDAVVIAERPRLAPHIADMRERLAQAMGIGASSVSVKGKTNEGVGELGRGDAIAVHAVALVARAAPGGER